MKKFSDFIVEARGITHATLSKKVAELFDKHKKNTDDHEVVRYVKSAHTGSSKHSVGSVKQHSLGYKAGKSYQEKRKGYTKHPIYDDIKKLVDKHGGKNLDGGGYIDTTDGYRHHFSSSYGTAYSSIEHQSNKRGD